MLALGQQLQALGLAEGGRLDPGSSLARHLMDAWERLGHTLALQYGEAGGAGTGRAGRATSDGRSAGAAGAGRSKAGWGTRLLARRTPLHSHPRYRPPGGSEAHAAFFQRARGDWEAATQGRDLLTAVRRAFSNVWSDAEKQVGREAGWAARLGGPGSAACERVGVWM